MKKFILRLLFFCLAPLPVLYVLNSIVDSGLRKSRHFYYSEWNDIFDGKINADLVISGTSRAWVQISPQILDSALRFNSYNIGMDGAPFKVQYNRLKIYLAHNKKPRYIIQEVGYTSTLVATEELPATQQFLPYLSDTAIWNMTQQSVQPFTLPDRYFPLFKYNNELPLVKEGIMSFVGKGTKSAKYKGYEGKLMSWDSSFYNFKRSNPQGRAWAIDAEAVQLFRDYLSFCKANDIRVIMVYPPAYIESLDYITNKEEILAVYNRFSKEYDIPFYNYMFDSLNYSKNNFYNSMHLNKQGSEIFSNKLATALQKYMSEEMKITSR